jgi:colanic acid biosynthesis protein WcaH
MSFLAKEDFLAVIANTPLVSIDLVIRNAAGAILLGRRRNEPAKDFLFVPGGRILKDETLEAAFARLCRQELGYGCGMEQARFLGAYTHKYANNALGVPGVSTHYVVLAYELRLEESALDLSAQHTDVCWASWDQVHQDQSLARVVHDNVLPYFPRDGSV